MLMSESFAEMVHVKSERLRESYPEYYAIVDASPPEVSGLAALLKSLKADAEREFGTVGAVQVMVTWIAVLQRAGVPKHLLNEAIDLIIKLLEVEPGPNNSPLA